MYPAANNSIISLVLVTLTFAITTIATMLSVVLLTISGFKLIPVEKFERFSHAIAGVTILLCGISIQFLGL
jgi:hypothetical protein